MASTPGSWAELSLLPPFSGGRTPPVWRISEDTVQLGGEVMFSAASNGLVVANLPAGARPGTLREFACDFQDFDQVRQALAEVHPSGDLVFHATGAHGPRVWPVQLDRITFAPAAA